MADVLKSVAGIIASISTPLQLAALALLLIYAVARLQTRGGGKSAPSQLQAKAMEFLFIAAIATLVVGVVGQPAMGLLEQMMLPSDLVFHGAVRSTSNVPIARARVILGSIDEKTTNELGDFDFTVPRNRALPSYKIQVIAEGYKPLPELTRTADELRDLEIRLEPEPKQIVKDFDPSVLVAQYYGIPHIFVSMHVVNASASIAVISDVNASLEGPDVSLPLRANLWTIVSPMGPYQIVTGPFPFPAGMNVELRIGLGLTGNIYELNQQIGHLPEYASQMACSPRLDGSVRPLSDDAFALVKNFAADKFIWREGDWHLKLSMTADGQHQSFGKDFSMSAVDVERLRASLGLIKRCISVRVDAPLGQDGPTMNFISK